MKRIFITSAFLLSTLLQSPAIANKGPGVSGGDTLHVAAGTPDTGEEKLISLTAGGYASWLHMAMFDKPSDNWINSSMLHNRLNFKAYAGNHVTLALEMRNRFVTGDMIKFDPAYAGSLAADDGWIDMSWNIFSGGSYALNTMIDRAYINFTAGNLEIRAGRQRINWSQALIWNPNDIFNTYSFFDFDYVERPGSDALRLTYSTGPASAVETVVKVDAANRITAAALGRFSLLNTDLQFLAGVTDDDFLTAGTGFSGAIGSFSIRGEATLFAPFRGADEEKNIFIATLGIDKAFSDKVTTLAQVMYSGNPIDLNSFTELYEGGLTARQLAFSKFSAAGQISYSPVPLLSISLSAIWYPDLDGYYAGPSIDFSLAENVDFSFLWQHFNSTIAGEETRINLGFIRIRYSF
ncbi:MAG: hypothetical protein MUE37_13285 [Bacteroidales bacterium]|nr:hypothetical protein [Bacteroidales bacterium]